MKTPLLTIITVIALIFLGGQTIKKTCKTGHHAWCVPDMWRHAKARALYDLKMRFANCARLQAQRIAANIAKLPELLSRRQSWGLKTLYVR